MGEGCGRNKDCTDCELHTSSMNVCIWGDGNPAHKIFLIGEAPGEAEARTERPFQGKSGQLLRQELAAVGLPSDLYVTNLVKCRPPENRKPERIEIAACDKYLSTEFDLHKPKYVLTLGATPTKALTKKAKITEVVGKVIELDGIKYMPCFHPSYILRDPGKLPAFRATLLRFKEMIGGNLQQKTEINVKIVGRNTLDEFLQLFQQEDEFVYDLETSGLDHYRPGSYVNCIGFYLPKSQTTWVLPIRKDPTLPTSAQAKILHRLASYNKKAIGHNVKFDSLWLRKKFGVVFYSHFDTMLAHYVLDENSLHGLKELARYFLNAPDYDLSVKEKKGNVDGKKLFTYCGWDCYYTYQLKKIFSRQLMKDIEARNLFNRLIMPVARLFERIETQGHYINMKRFADTRVEVVKQIAESLSILNKMAGKPINWNSPKQVGSLLYGDLNLVCKTFTDKGAPSTSEEALSDLEHPVVEALQKYREFEKFRSTYIDGWIGTEDEPGFMVDEYLFLSTKIHGTVTGRFSSRLHSIPRDGTIRNMIEAPDGWTFVQADLSQAELKVAAMASGDPELIRCFKEGIDVHWRTACMTLRIGGGKDVKLAIETAKKYAEKHGLPIPNLTKDCIDLLEKMGHEAATEIDGGWKEIRKKAKAINFGFLYGMGAPKFVSYAKLKYEVIVTLEEAVAIREGFFGLYIGLAPWHERMRKKVAIDGYVKNLISRKRRLPGIYSSDRQVKGESERNAINSPIQGYIGDHKTMAMLAIDDAVPSTDLVQKGEVHDAVLMWVRTAVLEETLPKIKLAMEDPPLLAEFGVKLSLPITVDIDVGSWGKGKKWLPPKNSSGPKLIRKAPMSVGIG